MEKRGVDLQAVVSFFSLIFWLFIVPGLSGLAFNFILPRERRTYGISFIVGFLVQMAAFEVVAIMCMTRVVFAAFTYCRRIYIVVALVIAAAGILRSTILLIRGEKSYVTLFPGEIKAGARELMSPRADFKLFKLYYSKESMIYWGIFFAIMAFQMVMSVVMASFDGDDAYYVVESVLAQQADVMNTILPYTGVSTSLDIRHALAVITMWIAFIAKMSGIHATIVSHTIMPLFFIPLVYLLYVEIGRILFRTRQHDIPVFMIIISFLLMFGNVSIYTPATFFFMRTWQGKALVGNLVFPMIFWVFFWMLEDVEKRKRAREEGIQSTISGVLFYRNRMSPWIMLWLINMLSGVCSSMGVIFGSGLIALLTLVHIAFSKRWTVIFGAFFCIIPNILYLAMYFSLFNR